MSSILPKVDLPSLLMALSFAVNLFIGLLYPAGMPIAREMGLALLSVGSLLFAYVLLYLRSGFLGETEPRLDYLVTRGPYRFCRHPLYLSFIIMILGSDLTFRSIAGFALTIAVSIPSAIYRGMIEDKMLKSKFGKEWAEYAEKTGFMLPRLRKQVKRVQSARSIPRGMPVPSRLMAAPVIAKSAGGVCDIMLLPELTM